MVDTLLPNHASVYGPDAQLPPPSAPDGSSIPAGQMDDAEYQAAIRAQIGDAIDYIDGTVAEQMAAATQYYRGDLFGNEEAGRSQVVMTEVRDTVLTIIPSLLRIFTASDEVVNYIPTNAGTVEQAEQATDYINHVFYQDNPGFQTLHSAFKDALIRKLGFIKWRWTSVASVAEEEFTGLNQGQVELLRQEPGVEILSGQAAMPVVMGLDPQTGQPISAPTYDIKIRRTVQEGRACVEAVPPEEVIWKRDGRDFQTCSYVGHRSMQTVSSLVAMGYDRATIEDNMGGGDLFVSNSVQQARNPAITSTLNGNLGGQTSPAMQEVQYVESYILIDKDGDGIAERRKVCSIGQAHYILHDELADEVPIAAFCPDPEPHMILGGSIADQTMDLQRIKSRMMRDILDSAAQSIYPRTAIVEGQVNLDDAMNKEMGALVRMRQPGMMQPLSEPFLGTQMMPIVGYLDATKEKRTGISAASQGLDPDVMQSTTAKAVQATVQGAQERIEVIARLFAENGLKRLFRGLLKLVVKHQDKQRMVRLRGKWVDINPAVWDADLDVHVNVALGRGTDQDKLQFLSMVAGKQQEVLQMLGPVNPLCNVSQLSYCYHQILALGGYKNGEAFFNRIAPEQLKQIQEMAQQNQKPSPDEQLVEIQRAKVTAEIERDRLKLEQERINSDREHEQRMKEIVVQEETKRLIAVAEIEAKYKTSLDVAELQGRVDVRTAEIAAAAKPERAND